MNDFLAISDTIKQAIAESYSKQNSGVKPDAVREKSKRGALVFDTIDKIFEEHSDNSSSGSLPFHLMGIDEDVRYSDARNANKSTQRMAEYLSQTKNSGFNVLDKSTLFQSIAKRENTLAEYGYDARNAKIELARMIRAIA